MEHRGNILHRSRGEDLGFDEKWWLEFIPLRISSAFSTFSFETAKRENYLLMFCPYLQDQVFMKIIRPWDLLSREERVTEVKAIFSSFVTSLSLAHKGEKIIGGFSTAAAAAAAAKSLQSCPTLRPQRQQPIRLPHPWDSPGKNTWVGCHFLLQGMKVKSESEVAQSCLTLRNPMDCSLPGSSAHGIFQARVMEWGAIAFSGFSTTRM